jgi:O-acetylserine/cysteine efflux transporter
VKPFHLALAVFVPVIWGLGFTFAKAALGEFPPILLMALRFTLTASVLVWFVARPSRSVLWKLCGISLISATIQYGLTFYGLKDLDASTAVLVVQLEVPFGALVAWVLLKERLGWRRSFGMVLAFVGFLFIVGEPRLHGNLTPLFLVVGGALSWAFGQVLVKMVGQAGGFTLIAWIAVFATPQLWIATWLIERDQMTAMAEAGWIGWGTVVYLGLIMTALGYGLWYHLLNRYQVNQVMPFLLLLPVTSVIGSIALLGETLTLLIAIGGAIVVAGVAVITIERPVPRAATAPGAGD